MNRSRTGRWLLAALLPVAALAACGDDDDGGETGSPGTTEATDDTAADTTGDGGGGGTCGEAAAPEDAPVVTIGAQDFGESAILAQVYGQCLEAAGFSVDYQDLGGFRDIEVGAFDSGEINLAPEYAASMLEFLNGPDVAEATSDAAETTELLQAYLDDEGLVALEPSAAIDTNSFVMTSERAEQLGITALSDLADHVDELRLGAPADCEPNPFCLPGLQEVYGADLSDGFTPLDAGIIADALESGTVDVGVIFSTDAVIVERGFVLLEDDQTMLAADNILPVLTAELAEVEGLSDLLDAVSAALTTENVTAMNGRFSIDNDDPEDIAADFLAEEGLA